MDYLLTAYQKLFSALLHLEQFAKNKDLYENIACIDGFLSEFRNVTFVLQKSLAHTDYLLEYEKLRLKYLGNDDCRWLLNKRNEVLKEQPFQLEKGIEIICYLPTGVGISLTKSFTVSDEVEYSSLLDDVKGFIAEIPAIEVFFSVEFSYRERGNSENFFCHIKNGIFNIRDFLKTLDETIGEEPSQERKRLIEKIENLNFLRTPENLWFIEDYVYYKEGAIFDKGEQLQMVYPEIRLPISGYLNTLKLPNTGNVMDDAFLGFIVMHESAYAYQGCLMPTFMVLYDDNTLIMDVYAATIKTTTYRKIQNFAQKIRNDRHIVSVFYVSEMLCYVSMEVMRKDYEHRKKQKAKEQLIFSLITSHDFQQYVVDSESVKRSYAQNEIARLRKINIDKSTSYMKPLIDAFETRDV